MSAWLGKFSKLLTGRKTESHHGLACLLSEFPCLICSILRTKAGATLHTITFRSVKLITNTLDTACECCLTCLMAVLGQYNEANTLVRDVTARLSSRDRSATTSHREGRLSLTSTSLTWSQTGLMPGTIQTLIVRPLPYISSLLLIPPISSPPPSISHSTILQNNQSAYSTIVKLLLFISTVHHGGPTQCCTNPDPVQIFHAEPIDAAGHYPRR